MDRTARIIVWLILDRSVGWGQPWADLDAEQFASVARVKVASAAKILAELLRDEIVRSHTVKGRLMYAVNRPPDPSGPKVEGKCRTCGQTGTIDLDPKWRPIPHDFFWKVPQVCDAAMLFCMGIIAEATMRWDDARRWPIVVPARISLQTFMAGGYGRSTIIEALNRLQAKKLGFIGSDRRDEEAKPTFKGKPGLYWLIPENFENGEKRTFRKLDRSGGRRTLQVETEPEPEAGTDDEAEPAATVTPRQAVRLNGETGAKSGGVEMAEPDEPKEPTRPIEFVSAPVGLCRKCRAYGPVDLVAEAPEGVEGNTPDDSPPQPADDPRSRRRKGDCAGSKPAQTRALVPANMADLRAEENFELFWQLFVVAGKSLNRVDRTRAAAEFRRYPEPIQGDIILWAIGMMQSAWKNQQYTPMPLNALKSQGWTRVAAERLIPDVQPKTKTDLAWDLYEARCRERGVEPLK